MNFYVNPIRFLFVYFCMILLCNTTIKIKFVLNYKEFTGETRHKSHTYTLCSVFYITGTMTYQVIRPIKLKILLSTSFTQVRQKLLRNDYPEVNSIHFTLKSVRFFDYPYFIVVISFSKNATMNCKVRVTVMSLFCFSS